MTMSDSDEYILTPDDMAAFCPLLRAQYDVGPAQSVPTQDRLWDLMGTINSIAYDHYRHITNAHLRSWTDKVFTALVQTQTRYGSNVVALYIAYMYYQFNASCDIVDSSNSDDCGQDGFPVDFEQRDARWPPWDGSKGLPNAFPWNWFANGATGLWKPPGSPPNFYDAINSLVDATNDALSKAGGSTGLVALVDNTYDSVAKVQQFERARFDPSNWTDCGTLVQNLIATSLWAEQAQSVATLLGQPKLTVDQYLFLLHLLIALGTSNSKGQQLARKIVSAGVTSREYPNDTFINQLTYLVLMDLADPMGAYGWTNQQIQAGVNALRAVTVNTDPASQAIQSSLTQHLKVLQSDASYPMQDPYAPAIGFTQRKTDTLYALDQARQTLHA